MPIGFETFNAQSQKLMDHNSLSAKYRGQYQSPVWTSSGTSTGTITVSGKGSQDRIFYYAVITERGSDGYRTIASGLSVSISGSNINWTFRRGNWGGSFFLVYGVF